MKLTQLQSDDLAHCVYVQLDNDPEDREDFATDEFLLGLLKKIESRDLFGISAEEIAWISDEADNLESIYSHNLCSNGKGIGDVLSARNILKKLGQ